MIDEVVSALPDSVSVELTEKSILDDEQLHAQYWDQIPVVLINDRVHTVWRVESARLSAALQEENE